MTLDNIQNLNNLILTDVSQESSVQELEIWYNQLHDNDDTKFKYVIPIAQSIISILYKKLLNHLIKMIYNLSNNFGNILKPSN